MIEFVPYIVQILIPLAVGLVAAFLFRQKKALGLALMSVAFFVSAIPAIVSLALGGPFLTQRLHEQGYTAVEIGMFTLYLFAGSVAFEIVSAVLFVVGLFKLTK